MIFNPEILLHGTWGILFPMLGFMIMCIILGAIVIIIEYIEKKEAKQDEQKRDC